MSNTELFVNSILQILLLQAWNPYYLTFNAPLWSLSTLMFFYLAFPFRLPAAMRRYKWKVLALVWLVYLIPPVLVVASESYGSPGPACCIAIRCCACRNSWRHPGLRVVPRLPRPRHGAGRGSLAALVALVVAASWWPTTCSPRAPSIGTSCCTTACCCRPSCCWCAARARRPEERLSAATGRRAWGRPLSLFALHVPMFTLFSVASALSRAGALSRRLARLHRGGGRVAIVAALPAVPGPAGGVLRTVPGARRGAGAQWLVRRLMPTPALAKVPRLA